MVTMKGFIGFLIAALCCLTALIIYVVEGTPLWGWFVLGAMFLLFIWLASRSFQQRTGK